ncbi:MAG: hypothetical protein ACYC0C_03425 [Devosia sp.]
MAFADSANKKAIRDGWNLPLLRHWENRTGRKLAYFGLPGPRMLDLLAWKSVLAPSRTAVEEHPKALSQRDLADDAAAELMRTAMKERVSDGLQILRGDIGTIIVKGFDDFASMPAMSTGPADSARFRYDLHNLDFDGGLGFINKATGEAPRVDALRKLVERQKGHSFLLFLTVNVRNTVGAAIADYLDRLQRQAAEGAIAWYLSRTKGEVEYRLKAIVPVLMGTIAQTNGFALRCLPPVAYTGHAQARMLHFTFEFSAEDRVFAGVNQQATQDLLLLPMLEATDGAIGPASLQHPQCDIQTCRPLLEHLKAEELDAILGPQSGRPTGEPIAEAVRLAP